MIERFLFTPLILLLPFVGQAQNAAPYKAPAQTRATPDSDADLATIQKRLLDVLPTARKAVVCIQMGQGSGSGVITDAEKGIVMTAGHVSLDPGTKMKILLEDGRTYDVEALGRSQFADSGFMKITSRFKDLPSAPIAPIGKTKVGDWVFAMGHLGGHDKARGSVVRLGRVISQRSARIRTDCRVIFGDSGGPLYNMDGEVIGINSRIGRDGEKNYHCPIESYRKDWDDLMDGKVLVGKGGYLGIVVVERKEPGMTVDLVVDGSAAEKFGIKEGDIVLSIEDEVCNDIDEFREVIGYREEGEPVDVKLLRGDEEIEKKVFLGRKPRY